jgi:uncharacterized membrane protein HdeD (DUF308 family)
MLSKKGSTLHINTGKVYFWAMFGVFLTSSTMFFFKPQQLLFLFLIGVFSFYQTWSGTTIIKYKDLKTPIMTFDKVITVIVSVSGMFMITFGIFALYTNQISPGITILTFGIILIGQGIIDYRNFTVNRRKRFDRNPKAWLRQHIARMGGSYIATITAFIVVNNTILPNLIAWLAPALIGTFVIIYAQKKYKVR